MGRVGLHDGLVVRFDFGELGLAFGVGLQGGLYSRGPVRGELSERIAFDVNVQ